MQPADIEQIEIDVVLEAINRRYGYDFRNYARSSLKRRLTYRMSQSGLRGISDLLPRLLHDETFFECFLCDMSVTVTEMFRDPFVFRAIRQRIVPILKTYPFVKIWHAGCATGEEVYSMAILLQEEGFLDRAQIYATDYNNVSLHHAREGIYPLRDMTKFTTNYREAGGSGSFFNYYHAKYDSAKMCDSLRHNVTFAHHNLVVDGAFGEMNLILCRNVLIYFNRDLQNRVLRLLHDSLCHRGFLCLGTKETLGFSDIHDRFQTFLGKERIYQHIGSSVDAALRGTSAPFS